MEPSLCDLTYKGSIPEAIIESQKQKKLFVVYVSGTDSVSNELEKTTWIDPKVVNSLSKHCILLHLPEGSSDAAKFSAIYPVKSVPSIAAIGYNGVQIWHREGFVNAEDLASSLEKGWFGLHVQETTASVLSAALASRKMEVSTSGETSSSSVLPSPSVEPVQSLVKPSDSSVIEEDNSDEQKVEKHTNNLDDKTSPRSLTTSKSSTSRDDQPLLPTTEVEDVPSPLVVVPENSTNNHLSSIATDGDPPPAKVIAHHSVVLQGGSDPGTVETDKHIQDIKKEPVHNEKVSVLDNNTRVSESCEVHLSIRLPSGASLQERFPVASTLRAVKDYVDSNQGNEIGSYDLAIPYPRKVFSDQDLSKSLSELALFNRQALIVVLRHGATSYNRGVSDQITSTVDSSNGNEGGYFPFLRGILSYVNPLSYFRGNPTSSSSGQAQTDAWEYGPNASLNNNLAGQSPFPNNYQNPRTASSGRNGDKSRQPTSSRFGSNIHTLKHDDDDAGFNDRNAFWNGNSTQYGGNNDGK
ncbi:hypothetical protein K2173_019317 [Erythroxylum novogranatense]|uniref:UBX domain-containing protein n=1 Tax=Erythroxylum novogranatense TaxID=1862640 RepID=A0AAV8SUI5_9ROSI|nr:hypothetical protein K2173_019317 [Erythroxylum novogranatense]